MALLQSRKHKIGEFSIPEEAKENCFPSSKYIRYDIANILRCHSKDNNPQDATTRVNDVAFALNAHGSANDAQSGSNIFATCGLNVVNIIDASTGKVLQRFNDECTIKGHKEVFFRVQWTKINNLNVLAAAGLHGQIKIIIPKISSCVLRIDAHEGQIDSLIFHPKYPNVLISGSYDNKIQFWKLNIDENLTRDDFNVNDLEFKYDHLGTVELSKTKTNFQDHVLSMCFINDHLIINTVFNNYYIYLNEFKPFGSFMSNSADTISPGRAKEMNSENVVSYMTSQPESQKQTSKSKFKAEELEIVQEPNEECVDKDDLPTLLINKLVYLDNLIVADVLNTNSVYLFKIEYTLDDSPTQNTRRKSAGPKPVSKIRFLVERVFNIAEELSLPNTGMCFFRDGDRHYVIKTTEKGFFYKFELNVEKMRKGAVMKFKIPDEYTIKLQKTLKKIPINNYGLTEPMKIINCAISADKIVCVTSQNMVIIWKKCD